MPEPTNVSLTQLRAEVVNSKQIPTIPAVLVRILQVVDGDRTSVKDLVQVVERDESLTGRILRLSNSAFFGFSRSVATLSRAVMLLGFSTVKNLALGVKVWEALTAGRRRAEVEQLWVHSSLVAAASRLLARRLKVPDPEEAFTAGLLHDIGKVILALRFPEEYQRLMAEPGEDGIKAERQALGVDHAQVGGWLAESWTLPPLIVTTTSGHHEPLTDVKVWDVCAVVNLANRIVKVTDFGEPQPSACVVELLESLNHPELTLEAWTGIAEQLKGQEAEIKGFFAAGDGEAGG